MQFTLYFVAVLVLFVINKMNVKSIEAESVEVITKLGRVKGSLMQTRLGKTIYAFRGLNYAEPHVGNLRFKQAIPVRSWTGVFDATKEGPACIQEKGIDMREDCLTLNIYTKQLSTETVELVNKSSVIVFLHPGGFFKISSQSFLFGPKYLLDEDIVLVTINYRLASLGFMNTGDYHAPGNIGLKDQIEALRWIQKNIAIFGGDPNSVTLTGQSAGSRAIVAHMVSPMAKGLFHRAIGMSGSTTLPIHPQREQLDLVVRQAKALNCPTNNLDAMFDCFRERPAKDFGNSFPCFLDWRSNPVTIWYPAIEQEYPDTERFLPDDIELMMKAGAINQVPFMIGVTKDEFSFKATDAIEESLKGNNEIFNEMTRDWEKIAPICFQYERDTERSKFISMELAKFYFNNEPLSLNNSDALRQLYANALVHFPSYRAASLVSKYSSTPVYFYNFIYESPYSLHTWDNTKKPKGGVAHGDDLQYLFNIENDFYDEASDFPIYGENDPEIIMVKRLTSLWAYFAKTGESLPKDSSLFGNVVWERLRPGSKKYLEMGREFVLRSDYLAEIMKLWDDLFP